MAVSAGGAEVGFVAGFQAEEGLGQGGDWRDRLDAEFVLFELEAAGAGDDPPVLGGSSGFVGHRDEGAEGDRFVRLEGAQLERG